MLPIYAERLDLPVAVVGALHQLGSATTLSTVRRVIASRVSRSGSHSFRSYAPRVAAAVLDLFDLLIAPFRFACSGTPTLHMPSSR